MRRCVLAYGAAVVSTSEAVVSGVDEAVGMHGYPCWTLRCSPNTFAVISSDDA